MVDCGPEHVPRLDALVDALVVTDLPSVVWSPHRHPEAVDAVLPLVQVVLIDSIEEPTPPRPSRERTGWLEDAYVVDLAWLRSTPWRERIAATFDPPLWRAELGEAGEAHDQAPPGLRDGGAAPVRLAVLAPRLGARLVRPAERLAPRTRASTRRQEVDALPRARAAPGGARASRASRSRPRPGCGCRSTAVRAGCRRHASTSDGRLSEWTVLGASRGEAGILGEGIRQALLRDPTYRPALEAAGAMVQ